MEKIKNIVQEHDPIPNCITAMLICWYGEPELIDALIYFLMK